MPKFIIFKKHCVGLKIQLTSYHTKKFVSGKSLRCCPSHVNLYRSPSWDPDNWLQNPIVVFVAPPKQSEQHGASSLPHPTSVSRMQQQRKKTCLPRTTSIPRIWLNWPWSLPKWAVNMMQLLNHIKAWSQMLHQNKTIKHPRRQIITNINFSRPQVC